MKIYYITYYITFIKGKSETKLMGVYNDIELAKAYINKVANKSNQTLTTSVKDIEWSVDAFMTSDDDDYFNSAYYEIKEVQMNENIWD